MIYQITETAYLAKLEKGSPEWKSLNWNTGDYSYDDLMEQLESNHFYRANFRTTSNKGEKEFQSAQVIFLDYDKGDVLMNDYIAKIKVRPSFYYRSHSSDESGNRFRIGYVLDKPVYSPDEYRVISKAIADNNGGGLSSKDFDPASFSPYQLWCGSEYEFNRTSSIIPLDKIKQRILQDDPEAFCFEKRKSENSRITIERRELSSAEQKIKDDFFCSRYSDFIKKYMPEPIVCSFPVKENEAFYFFDKNNYFEIIRKYQLNDQRHISHYKKNIKGGYEPLRFYDGERRRSKISASVSFIHQIKPDISLSELLAQAINYINQYIDNTDDSITNCWIWNMVFDEFINPKNYTSNIHKSLRLKKEYFCCSSVHHKTKIKEYKKQYCLSLYDPDISIENNLLMINEYLTEETNSVLSVSKRTLMDYLKEEGIVKKEIDQLKFLYKEGLLTKESLDSFKDKVNRKTFFKYKRLIK